MMAWSERRWRPRMDPGMKSEAIELLELRPQAASARASRLIGERQEGIILGASRFSSRRVREIMLPAEHISMLDVNASLDDCLITAHLEMHTRFPVAERPGDPGIDPGLRQFQGSGGAAEVEPAPRAVAAVDSPAAAEPSRRHAVGRLPRTPHPRAHAHRPGAQRRRQGRRLDHAGRRAGRARRRDSGRIRSAARQHAMPSGWAWVVGGGLAPGPAEGA